MRGRSRLCCLMRYFPERWFRRWGGVGLRSPLACGFLQETSPLMVQKRALLEAVAYNLRVFLTLPLPLPWIFGALFLRPLDW